MNNKPVTRWYQGLQVKVTAGLGMLVAFAMLAMGGMIYLESIESAEKQSLELLVEQQEDYTDALKTNLESVKRDLLTLTDMPPIQAILRAKQNGDVDPFSGDTLAIWQHRLKQIFSAHIMHRSIYQQISFVDTTGNVIVIVRTNHGEMKASFDDNSQQGYLHEDIDNALNLKQNSIYYSDINFNKNTTAEGGAPIALLNLFSPVYRDNKIKGILTLSLFAEPLLTSVIIKKKGVVTYIVDNTGHFIKHPDASKQLNSEHQEEYTLKNQFPSLFAKIGKSQLIKEKNTADDYAVRDEDSHSVLALQKVFFDDNNKSRYWQVVYRLPDQIVFQEIYKNRDLMLMSSAIMLLFAVTGISLFASRKIVKPIKKLANTADLLEAGDLSVRIDETDAKDEFKTLYQAFNAFAERQQNSTHRLEQKVKSRTEYLSNVITHLVDGLIIIDNKGIIKSCNPAASNIFGYSLAEMVDQNIKMLMPEPYRSNHDGYLQNYQETGIKKIIGIGREIQGRRKDGTIFPADLAVSELRYDGECRFLGSVRDISERKLMEQKIQQTEKRLKKQYDNYFSLTRSNKIVFGNLSLIFQEITANSSKTLEVDRTSIWLFSEDRKKLVCHNLFDLKTTTHTRSQELFVDEYPEYFEALNKGIEVNVSHAANDPVTRCFNMSYLMPNDIVSMLDTPIYKNNAVTGVFCIEHRDQPRTWTTDEIQYLRSLAHLVSFALEEQERQQFQKELAEKNRELEQANTMKTEFLANMSHELRTPLNAIIGFSEILKDGVLGQLTEEQAQYSQEIFASGSHLLDLINEILDLSKIESGKTSLELDEVSISELLQGSLYIVREKAAEHNITLELNNDEKLGWCLLDMRKLKQIIYNLLSNAVKFTPDGGSVTLSAKLLSRQELTAVLANNISSSYDGEYVEISVSDTGIGIADNDIDKIFRPFEQVDGTLSRQYEGTGLGLSLVKSLTELHGGTIAVRSKLGEGSVFSVYLPYKQVDTDTDRDTDTDTKIVLTKQNPLALIIEDDPPSAELTSKQLFTLGIKSDLVRTGEDAFTWLQEHQKPDLIILDLLLPSMSGLEFLGQIKRQFSDYSDIPVIIISIIASDNARQGIAQGALAVLQKPIQPQELDDVIASLGLIATQAEKESNNEDFNH
jgi:PAS domain S-box-containing protein